MSRTDRVRIIGGQWRSRLIQFPDNEQLRPTPDRVRETLFNWLGQDLTGRTCLDLFAGSGALGFEAASRGAERVTMVEHDVKALHSLRISAAKLPAPQVKSIHMDVRIFLENDTERYDVVFLDPPFGSELLAEILPMLPSRMTEEGVVYVESRDRLVPDDAWSVWKQSRASHVYYGLLKLNRNG